ncbi:MULTISPECIES: LysR family transcriptional regulator [Stappiaceae]|uniref:LysR family transcriptional regulator n=1 Tax=Stappiaceae TaxID=2821832 RepID=UPI000B8BF299|nr:LysR family transcriptional regulator [Labrenzia sp. VG12]ASP33907.1 LysR family transcriptional regulator [Labrenzia sp. VG12]
MDTDSLRLFVLATEKLNISAAGRELGLAPAVASSRLAKLEQTVGADLLHRSTRKVALSLEGAEFLPFAREILAQEDAARAALGFASEHVTGTLRFAASSTFAQAYIIPLLPEFLERYPGIDLDLRLSDLPFDLIEGSFDLALRNAALQDSSLKARKLADDTRVLVASPDYLARHGTPSDPSDLAAHRYIAFRSRLPKQLRGPDGNIHVFDPANADCRLVMDDGLSLKLAACAGVGIGLTALWNAAEDMRENRLVRVLPDYEVQDDTGLWLIYPKSNVLTAKVRVFIDFLLERIGRNPPWLTG